MSIAIRLQKLRFLAQELELAYCMVVAQPSDHYRRVFSRRVLIRTQDFAAHLRALRKPAQQAGYDLSSILLAKEAYAKGFEEYYREQRNRLCGHVQDVEWLHRLQLWIDIEASKVEYFAGGAREVYERLGEIGLPDYQPYSSFPELGDADFAAALAAAASARPANPGVTMGVDILAATRPNTTVMLNFHPLHQRGAQLAAIGDWIGREVEVEAYVRPWINARRICRAQIATDVVSFADCLVTREDAGSAQKLDGLDKIMVAAGFKAPTPVDEFVRVFRFKEILGMIRQVRDKVGAHLRRDSAVDLPSLLRDLDGLALVELFRFYDKLWTVFATACRRDIRLRMYERNQERLYGVVSVHGGQEHVKPFDDRQPTPQRPRPSGQPDLSDASLCRAIQDWMGGGTAAEDARQLFWTAFQLSPVVEQCRHGGMAYEFRSAHKILLEHLRAARSSAEVNRLLALAESCANGWPQPLAEVLLRFLSALRKLGDSQYDGKIYWLLGRLPPDDEEWIDSVLVEGTHGSDPHSARLAIAAFYRRAMALRSGPGDRPPRRGIYATQTAALIDARPQSERLCVLLQLGSLFTSGLLTATQEEIEGEYPVIQAAAANEVHSVLHDPTRSQTASAFLARHDYVSLAVLIAEELRVRGDLPRADALVDAVANGEIAIPADYESRAQPLTNRAVALFQTQRLDEARHAAATVMRSYPIAIELKLHCLWILVQAGHSTAECREMLEYLRRSYVFTPGLEKMAAMISEGLSASAETEAPRRA
jgi:hypothetical protein